MPLPRHVPPALRWAWSFYCFAMLLVWDHIHMELWLLWLLWSGFFGFFSRFRWTIGWDMGMDRRTVTFAFRAYACHQYLPI